MPKFTRELLHTIQDIVDGEYYSEQAITIAVSATNDHETKILLVNLMNGLFTFEMKMQLQTTINKEYLKLTQ